MIPDTVAGFSTKIRASKPLHFFSVERIHGRKIFDLFLFVVNTLSLSYADVVRGGTGNGGDYYVCPWIRQRRRVNCHINLSHCFVGSDRDHFQMYHALRLEKKIIFYIWLTS